MELVYCVSSRCDPGSKEWMNEERPCTSLSCKNILALSKPHEDDTDADSNAQFDVQFDIVVFDLDKPWEPHNVTMAMNSIVKLQWDSTGTKLLIIDNDGQCQVWEMKDHLLDQWTCLGTSVVVGEEVLAVAWFHNGLQIIFDPDKREKVLYMDKFVRNTRLHPSLIQLGGSHIDGWIIVTSSGLVNVGAILPNGEIISALHTLSAGHLRLSYADIAHTGTGEVMVATSDGQLTSAIQCFLVSIKLHQKTITLSSRASASLYMKTQMEYGGNESQMMRITSLSFMNVESSDTLLVCCGSLNYSCLEVWHLLDQMLPLHKMFSMNTNPDTMNKTPKWMHKATISHPSLLTSIAGPKLPMSRNLGETTGFLPYIAVAYKDGSLQVVHRYTFQVITTTNLDSLCQQLDSLALPGQPLAKRPRVSIQLSAMTQTGSGCGIVGVQSDRVYLFRTFNGGRDSTMQLTSGSIVLLLEYCMLTGCDWWDVMLAVRQGMLMSIYQSLTDNFQKQTHNMQDYIFMRLLSLKMALYSSYSAGYQKAVDCHARLVLHAIATLLRSLLKPKMVSAKDQSPGEKVSAVCSKQTDGDLDNVLMNLETEEFHIDTKRKDKSTSVEVTLQSLQPLIQWVADFSLQLLASLPLYQSYSSFPGSSLLNDVSVLGQLRELLVIVYMWGQLSPGCLPSFTMTANLDCVKLLYRLLTKAWNSCKEGRGVEFDDGFMDECCVLTGKVLVPSLNQTFRKDNSGFTVFTQQLPLVFKFDDEPEYLHQQVKKSKNVYLSEALPENNQQHDIVRQIHLGSKPSETTRACSRCGCQSLLRNIAKTPIMVAWEQRWAKQCLCGGLWKLAK